MFNCIYNGLIFAHLLKKILLVVSTEISWVAVPNDPVTEGDDGKRQTDVILSGIRRLTTEQSRCHVLVQPAATWIRPGFSP